MISKECFKIFNINKFLRWQNFMCPCKWNSVRYTLAPNLINHQLNHFSHFHKYRKHLAEKSIEALSSNQLKFYDFKWLWRLYGMWSEIHLVYDVYTGMRHPFSVRHHLPQTFEFVCLYSDQFENLKQFPRAYQTSKLRMSWMLSHIGQVAKCLKISK